MSNNKIVTQKLTKKMSASIISAHPQTRLDQSLWAINWFDLKRSWLYELYNRIVIGDVREIGAYPIFKGRLNKVILSNDRLKRDMLLVVKYPDANAFLKMISKGLFQLKSIFRTSSVRHFQFGFMQKLNAENPQPAISKYTGKLRYLVHVCEGNNYPDIPSLLDYAKVNEIFPHFVGTKAALLGIQKENEKLKTLDFMLSYVLVFGGYDDAALASFVETDHYQQFVHSNQTNFIGLYDRII